MDAVDRKTRKSLPLSERDLRDLASLRTSALQREALADLTGGGISEASSEAAVLHAVWEVGLKAVLERVEEAGYQEMANERHTAERKKAARRRKPDWSEEP